MHDILEQMNQWCEVNQPFAVATVIQTSGSTPRRVGSMMAVRGDMQIAGSVSGGCVEGAVIEAAMDTLQTGVSKVLNFGVSDEKAWSMGLTCGGEIRVFIEKHFIFSGNAADRRIWQSLSKSVANNEPSVLLNSLDPAAPRHLLVYPNGKTVGKWDEINEAAKTLALQSYERRTSEEKVLNGRPVFIHVFPPKDRLIIIGAGHITLHLVAFAKEMGLETIVIDPRPVFASKGRFLTMPDQLIADWPDTILSSMTLTRDCYAVLLTHDPKIDDAAAKILLKSPVAYIGALGSRKSHDKRCARLKKEGLMDAEIARIKGPAGLIRAHIPAEIALSILAEVIQVKYALRQRNGG